MTLHSKQFGKVLSYFLGILLTLPLLVFGQGDPSISLSSGLLNPKDTGTLGLPILEGIETVTVFRPDSISDQYCNGVVMIGYKDRLYCQWQSSKRDEDSADTKVCYSWSRDGRHWEAPKVIGIVPEGGYCTSGGWWVNEDTLIAYINVWPVEGQPRGGSTFYVTSTDGDLWSRPKPVLQEDGSPLLAIFEQDPRALPSGRIVGAAHFQPGLIVSPIYTDDPSGVRGWRRARFENLSINDDVSRELEPSFYFIEKDQAVCALFRDQQSSYRCLASLSRDQGESWSTPEMTELPDSRTKQSAGNLPDGRIYKVGNPVSHKARVPLVLLLSNDGYRFDSAFLLRNGGDQLQPLIYPGKYKRIGYHYPKSMIWKDALYVAYATNKEDVEFTKIPIQSLLTKD